MDLWQSKASKEMTDFLNGFMAVEKIVFTGSMLNQGLLDIFSDADMEIHLSNNTALDLKRLLKSMAEHFCSVFGYEFFCYDSNDVLRVCFENGWRFDLTFIYPELKDARLEENSFADKIDRTINQFWFTSVMVLVKLGRKDYLIAAHLVLELCQLIIVIQMLTRDQMKNTDRHRFGDKEDVPVLHGLLRLEESNSEDEILSILFQAAKHMDSERTEKLTKIQYCLLRKRDIP
jgi:hypothetical protein